MRSECRQRAGCDAAERILRAVIRTERCERLREQRSDPGPGELDSSTCEPSLTPAQALDRQLGQVLAPGVLLGEFLKLTAVGR